ncbi:MAG: hypothetical protein K2W85_01620 [Phycisphaerales bacterium]|nr:hypothetical protein [Phycisphaerales bacterium]
MVWAGCRWASCLLAVVSLALPAVAQPGFGERKKPAEPKPAPEAPAPMPGPDAKPQSVTAPPEWTDKDPERKPPSSDAEQGVYFAHKTADGLRYVWSLPKPFEKGKAYDLIVMLHPDGQDFRWGPANHPRLKDGPVFKPDCIIVSVDGIAADARRPGARYFEPSSENAVRFRDVMLEFSRVFPVRGMYVYGQGEGGKFAAYFACSFPALADGVLAHGSGMVDGSAAKNSVPMVFMHGAKDSNTSLQLSFDAAEQFTSLGHPAAHVRVLRGYNDFTSAVSAADMIDYLRAMRTESPDVILERVRSMLKPKPPDELNYRPIPWFAGATRALKRITTPEMLEKPATAEQKAAAQALLDKIDAFGGQLSTRAREMLASADLRQPPLELVGGAWLGYLTALRDDFRGVPSVDALAKEMDFDNATADHMAKAQDLIETWNTSASDTRRFEAAIDALPGCFLYEGLPVDMPGRMRASMRKADELELSTGDRDRYEFVTLYEQGWRDGWRDYQKDVRRWRVE